MRERIEKAVSADIASRRQNLAAGLIGNLAGIDGGRVNQLAAGQTGRLLTRRFLT